MNGNADNKTQTTTTATPIRKADKARLSRLVHRTDIPAIRLVGHALDLLERSIDDGSFFERMRTPKK